jgi:glucose-6-phosphate 3-dehydrogenase
MKIGIIGCGSIAAAHINALEKLDSINDIYVFDYHIEKSQDLAKKFQKVVVSESITDLCSVVNGVIIATPNNTHLNILKNIISIKPIPVLCEKPLSSTLETATEFEKLAPPKSAIGFNYRFNKAVHKLELAKKDALLGELIFIDIAFNKNSALTKKEISWRDIDNQGTSSGAFGDLSSHLLDLVSYFADSLIDTDSFKLSKGIKIPHRGDVKLTNDDHSVATGQTKNGVIFIVESTKAAKEEDLGFHIRLICQHGELYYSSTQPEVVEMRHNNRFEVSKTIINELKILDNPEKEVAYWADSFYFQDKALVDLIYHNKQDDRLATIKDGLEIQRLISYN